MLELKKITKSYQVGENTQKVLNGIDLKFRRNEFTCILGSSGSGKTTLLNIIGGLDKYDSGDLIIEGISTKKYKDKDWDAYRNYRVGFIFQTYNLIMHQTVLSNVEIALTLSGVSKKERREKAITALEKVGLKDHINKKPNQLSGGQMQRVAIARALVNDPEIILADEPTGALDSKTSIQIMDLLKDIAKDKLVIMVTHNPEIANKYSTRIIELKDGLIINDSNPLKENKEEYREEKINTKSMSLKTSLLLSFNNLMTKKGRTLLTSFAGSIGIIGIALILALSNGVNNYAKTIEKDSLSDFPIKIERTSYDLLGTIDLIVDDVNEKQECEKGNLCTKDDIVKTSRINPDKGLIQKNNIKEFKKYIDNNKEINKYTDKIVDNYEFDLQVYTKDYQKVNPSEVNKNQTFFNEIDNKKYKIIKGKMPSNKNEVVLIIGKNRIVNDSVLYSLGIKEKKKLIEDLEKIKNSEKYKVESTKISYDDILNKEYKVILNTDYYSKEDNVYIDNSKNIEYLKDKIDDGINIKIVGIAEDKDTSTTTIGYTKDLKLEVINKISETDIYKKQIENPEINVLTNQEFDGVLSNYDDITKELAIYEIDNPSSISIYPKDYKSKEKIVELIDKYNDKHSKELQIKFSDVMKDLLAGVTKAVNIVSYVLIGFVAISLIVSSIMIAIITYISVLERTKEIGILRAIGASKKDIVRVFRAETIIEGLIAGVLGIAIALLISVPINVIVSTLAKIKDIAHLSLSSSILLILLSVALNVIAGTIPSKMAAKKDPVESLRTE